MAENASGAIGVENSSVTRGGRSKARRGLRRRLAVASVGVLALAGLGGCAGLGERMAKEDGKTTIAVVAKGYASPFWATVAEGVYAAGKDLKIEVTFNGPDTETDVVRQVDQVNLAYVKHPDAFVFAALDSSASVIALEQFQDAGIPVVAFDSGVPGSDIPLSTVATDNKAAAAEAAKHMIELTGGKGELAVICHSSTSVTGTDRRDGFVEYIEANAPDMKIVDIQYNDSDQAKAEQQASAIIQAHPNLVGLFATDDDGAVASAQTAKRSGKDVKVIGFDSGAVQIDLIKQGSIAGSVTQNPYQMGYRAVETALAASKGEVVPLVIDSGFYWYDANNLDDEEIQQAVYE